MDDRRAAERDEARTLRVLQLALIPVVIIVAMVRFSRDGVGAGWILAAGLAAIAFSVATTLTRKRILKRFGSREDLSAYISSLSSRRRLSWIWLEYVLARNTARGTYAGEPPSDYVLEADSLARTLVHRMRIVQRIRIASMVFSSCVVAAMAVWLHTAFPELVTVPEAFVIWLVPSAFCLFVIVAFRGSEAQRRMAHRLEETLPLPSEQRWAILTDIARDEFQSAVGPHS